MRLFWIYVRIELLGMLRNRMAMFFSVVFPSLLLLMFGRSTDQSQLAEIATMIVFINYAVQSVTLMSLGIKTSSERNSEWALYIRTLPVKPAVIFVSKIAMILVIAVLSLILVMGCSHWLFSATLPISDWLAIASVAILGGIPMALLSLGLGYLVHPASARNVFVILNLGLLFACVTLPGHGLAGDIRNIFPSYQWMMVTFSHFMSDAGHKTDELTPWLWMFAYTIAFYFFAIWSYRRCRNTRSQ